MVTGLGILNVVLDYQLNQLVEFNMQQLQHALIGCISSENPKIIASLCILLSKVIKAYPLSQPIPAIAPFYAEIEQTISTILTSEDKAPLW